MTKNAKQTDRRWSAAVTRGSNALDLENGVFTLNDPHRIARSLKHSAECSRGRKGTPLQSAMSMLNFYLNRGGTNISARQKNILTRAKEELRHVFHNSAHPVSVQK